MDYIGKEKSESIPAHNDSMAFLPEVMEILIHEYEEMYLHQKAVVLKKQLESLSGFYGEFGGNFYLSDSPIKWFQDSYRRSYLLCKDLIKSERQAKHIKHKDLVEGIYEDVETVVRIENGIQNPSHKKYAILMERLTLPKEKYHSLQIREGEEVFKIDRKITLLYARHEYECAKIELEKIKLLMDTGNSINRQYLKKQEALLDLELKHIQVNDFFKRVKEALKETYAGEVDNPKRVPTIEEVKLFNYIGVSYRRQKRYEDGIHLYEQLLGCYKNSNTEPCDYYRGFILLLRNYILLLEESGRTDKALEVIRYVILYEMVAMRGGFLDYVCAELACVYDSMNIEDREKKKAIERYIRYAFYISDLFERKENNKLHDKYYKTNICSKVDWY